jgi:hypothetical protein
MNIASSEGILDDAPEALKSKPGIEKIMRRVREMLDETP